jgi:galactokinase
MFSPGRVNIIGEHIDYNGGLVFPAAISLGIYAAVAKNSSEWIIIRSTDFPGEEVRINIREAIIPDEKISWGNYPRGVVLYLRTAGYPLTGANILLHSTLPKSSGLSSSACLECLMAAIVAPALLENDSTRAEMALLCQRVENEFIGVKCGIMDQMSIALGKKNHALLLNTADISFRRVPLDLGEYLILIMNTKKPRNLVESKYNERLAECQQALAIIRENRHIDHLVEARLDDIDAIGDPVLRRRARHVITEQLRVQEAADALEKKDLIALGNLLDASHASLKNDYEVTGIELDTLVDAARNFDGCIGARMTGAGFGGCAIALVHKAAVSGLIEHAGAVYLEKTGLAAEFYPCATSDGVGYLHGGQL